MKYVTIIGSRDITNEEFVLLRELATKLNYRGYILRSGGASGADSAINHLHNVEIIVPWSGFNGLNHDGRRVFALDLLPDKKLAMKKALEIHPASHLLNNVTTKLHTRNIYQVIGPRGKNGVKSDLVVYCSDVNKKEIPIGGTRTAVVYAQELGIPTYNIRDAVSDIENLLWEVLQAIEDGKEEENKKQEL